MRALIVTYVALSLLLIGYGWVGDSPGSQSAAEDITVPQARFELYAGKDDEYWWRLKGPDNQVMASGEGYTDEASALAAIQNVKKYGADARLERFDAK